MVNKQEIILQYYQKIKASHKELTKKEAFKDLLNRLYAGDDDICKIIDKITLGAEAAVVNIPRADKLHRGSADTLYNNIIIEFENDLKMSYKHAKEQLAGYMLGQFNSGQGYNFTLIVSDFIHWKVVAPHVDQLDRLDMLQEHELELQEVESASFTLTETNAEEFYYWIDRFLFKEEKQKASLKSIEEAFGHQSPVFIESFRELNHWFIEAKKFGLVQVSYEQWHKFLSIAYGSFEARESIFLIHTYLSIFAKMLAYSVVSNDDYIDDNEMHKILDGSIFNAYNITNFVDNDFFHWVNGDRSFYKLKKVFRLIAQEISAFDFEDVDEDILKGVYQELIDLDTRHALGEYYTPDWLCERIVSEFDLTPDDKILDPSCGSGSFLRAIIHRLKKLNPESTAEEINGQVYGIDIHPLSVQIAKTTVLLSLGKEIAEAKNPVHLNVILANTLLAPEGIKDLFGSEFVIHIDRDKYLINTQVLENVGVFDSMLNICDELAEQTMHKKITEIDIFANILRQSGRNGFSTQLVESFYKIYLGFKKVKEQGRDGIWKFIVSNLYKPYFLANKFDYIVGNPPWFTFSSIKNEDYQDILNKLAVKYEVKPIRVANYPHLEIAAIFQAYCSSYFLKEGGRQAYVLPRSFFNADHHDNSRSGKAQGFRLTGIWDMNDVSPLFRIPSCVLFSEKASRGNRKLKSTGVKGRKFSGKLTQHNCHYNVAGKLLTEIPVKWYFAKQGQSTAFSVRKGDKNTRVNPYKSRFKQGATIVPRSFYFVDLAQAIPDDFDDRILNIKTSESVKADAKPPWRLAFTDRIESRFLFRTALSRSVLPFALYKPDFVVLPITIDTDQRNQKKIRLHAASELMNLGYLNASRWFYNSERIWDIKKTDKSKNMTAIGRLDFQRGLSGQNLNAPYLVLYGASAKDANALVLDRKNLNFDFVAESKTYVFYTHTIDEAYYLSTILNSPTINTLMKDFQTRGLFGPRDVHKKILDIYFPQFSSNNHLHKKLADLGRKCHNLASIYLAENQPVEELSAYYLGKLRLSIRTYLATEMELIDKLSIKIMNNP